MQGRNIIYFWRVILPSLPPSFFSTFPSSLPIRAFSRRREASLLTAARSPGERCRPKLPQRGPGGAPHTNNLMQLFVYLEPRKCIWSLQARSSIFVEQNRKTEADVFLDSS